MGRGRADCHSAPSRGPELEPRQDRHARRAPSAAGALPRAFAGSRGRRSGSRSDLAVVCDLRPDPAGARPGSILINCGRGGLLNLDDVHRAPAVRSAERREATFSAAAVRRQPVSPVDQAAGPRSSCRELRRVEGEQHVRVDRHGPCAFPAGGARSILGGRADAGLLGLEILGVTLCLRSANEPQVRRCGASGLAGQGGRAVRVARLLVRRASRLDAAEFRGGSAALDGCRAPLGVHVA
jgi:hypothetical protein